MNKYIQTIILLLLLSLTSHSQTPFVTSASLGNIRNDFNGWLGMKFTVGLNPIYVTDLGRMYIQNNQNIHNLKLINANTGLVVSNSLTTLSMAGGINGQFLYSQLVTPLTLLANNSYYLVCQEIPNGDSWATEYTTITTTSDAICGGAILSNDARWVFRPPANTTFGPLNFKYIPINNTSIINIINPLDGSIFFTPANIPIQAISNNGFINKVDFFEGSNLLGTAFTTPYIITWNTINLGNYILTAKETDFNGSTTTSSPINVSVIAQQSPDLIIWGPSALNYQITNQTFINTDCAVIEGQVQSGTRKLLKFTTETRNIGPTDWYLGNPIGNTNFVWAPCHGHYHFNNFMSYELHYANGQLAAFGNKVGFCLTDSLRWDSAANPVPKYGCSNQGIQKGWGDVYTYVTAGQWIDITGLPDGYYILKMTVNPKRTIIESDYSNNAVQIPITIGMPAPVNDNIINAQILNGNSIFSEINNFSTKEVGEPNHAGNIGGHSIWFSWIVPNNQSVIIDTIGSQINTLLAVYTGNNINNLLPVTNNDDIAGVFNRLTSRVIFNPIAGITYMIAIDGYNGAFGNITINLNQSISPSNDNFINAQVIVKGSGSINSNNLLATKETSEPNLIGNIGGKSIWYQWTCLNNDIVTFDTINSDFDTMLGIYVGNNLNNLTLITSNDDMGGNTNGRLWSRVSFSALAGTTYKIKIDGYNGKSGSVVLNGTSSNNTPLF